MTSFVSQIRPPNAAKTAGLPRPTKSNVSYGPHPRNILDFYQAPSRRPTPLIVFIHGGGFVKGDKSTVGPGLIRVANAVGISVASINYRFIDGDKVMFPMPQQDGARAVQFLRSKAREWNIDPTRVACSGGSAGAGISMWIAFHDEMADPQSDDPVLRQSTRICAVATQGGQSTYDPNETQRLIGGRANAHPGLLLAYGLKSFDEVRNPSPATQKLFDEVSVITHLTKDDPPLFMVYSEPDVPLPPTAKPTDGLHHPNYGKHLQKKMNELGIENTYVHTADKNADATRRLGQFFIKHLRPELAGAGQKAGAN